MGQRTRRIARRNESRVDQATWCFHISARDEYLPLLGAAFTLWIFRVRWFSSLQSHALAHVYNTRLDFDHTFAGNHVELWVDVFAMFAKTYWHCSISVQLHFDYTLCASRRAIATTWACFTLLWRDHCWFIHIDRILKTFPGWASTTTSEAWGITLGAARKGSGSGVWGFGSILLTQYYTPGVDQESL